MHIRAEYPLQLSDFRKASYYIMFRRNRKAFRIAFIVLLLFFGYVIIAHIKKYPVYVLPFFIAVAYMFWIILVMGSVERKIRSYAKSPASLLGRKIIMIFGGGRMSVKVPDAKVNYACDVRELAAVFELATLFLIYLDGQNLYILPKSALKEKEISQLQKHFTAELGENFQPYVKKSWQERLPF